MEGEPDAADRPAWPSPRRLALIAAFYLGAAILGTYPAITTARTSLPWQFADPLVHLWTMRWHKHCLMEGRLPFLAPGLQHPVGAPVGYLPPLQYQSLLYLGLSSAIANDVLCYNIIWFSGFVLTGVGAYLLGWYVLRDGWAALLAGLLAMLGGPMTFFAGGQVEQLTLGWFPIFLIAWIRFVDRPAAGRLLAAAGLYLLLASSAPYYGVFAVFPATLYLAWFGARSLRGGRPFLRARLGWLSAFVGLTLPAMLVLFSSQIWAMTHGFPMDRAPGEFELFKASPESYAFPALPKLLARAIPPERLASIGDGVFPSYLGLVTAALLVYAAAARVRFERASFWWLGLGMLVVLSFGASLEVMGVELPMPAAWLREYGQILKPVRVPGRFAFFATVLAALIAAAGLRHLLARVPGRAARPAVGALVLALATADLANVPFATSPMPAMPDCYAWIKRRDPDAALFEAPHSNVGWRLPALCTYWQSFHGMRTSAGYTADLNRVHELLVSHPSPFHANRLANPEYLRDAGPISFDLTGILGPETFDDFAWLSLRAFGFDYVVLHHRPGDYPELAVDLGEVKRRLAPAKVFEDDEAAVFEVARLRPPSRPVVLCAEGWRGTIPTRKGIGRIVDPVSRLALYSPGGGTPVVLALRAMTKSPSRKVELRDGGTVLCRWELSAGTDRTLVSPPLDLGEGLHRLELCCDGVEPDAPHVKAFQQERAPYGLWVSAVGVGPTAEVATFWGGDPDLNGPAGGRTRLR